MFIIKISTTLKAFKTTFHMPRLNNISNIYVYNIGLKIIK